MNESGLGLFNALLDIRNGCLTKKLQLFKDDNKTEKSQQFPLPSTTVTEERHDLCEINVEFVFDCLEKTIRNSNFSCKILLVNNISTAQKFSFF